MASTGSPGTPRTPRGGHPSPLDPRLPRGPAPGIQGPGGPWNASARAPGSLSPGWPLASLDLDLSNTYPDRLWPGLVTGPEGPLLRQSSALLGPPPPRGPGLWGPGFPGLWFLAVAGHPVRYGRYTVLGHGVPRAGTGWVGEGVVRYPTTPRYLPTRGGGPPLDPSLLVQDLKLLLSRVLVQASKLAFSLSSAYAVRVLADPSLVQSFRPASRPSLQSTVRLCPFRAEALKPQASLLAIVEGLEGPLLHREGRCPSRALPQSSELKLLLHWLWAQEASFLLPLKEPGMRCPWAGPRWPGWPTGPAGPGTCSCPALACLPVLPARLLLGQQAAWRAPLAAAGSVLASGRNNNNNNNNNNIM